MQRLQVRSVPSTRHLKHSAGAVAGHMKYPAEDHSRPDRTGVERPKDVRGGAAREVLCRAMTTFALSHSRTLALVFLAGCIGGNPEPEHIVPGGNAARGELAMETYGCGFCHAIPGVEEVPTIEGPPLAGWAERQYIAGAVTNTPENLILWLVNPHAIEPGTAMPNLGVSEQDARDMATFLYERGDANPLGPPHLMPVRWLHRLATGGGGGEEEVWYDRAAGVPKERQIPLEPPSESDSSPPGERGGEGN